MLSPIDFLQDLVRCPSVTPKDAGAQILLSELLKEGGFTCHHLPFGQGEEEVPNLFARIGQEGPHVCFGGHTDVVPTGPEDQWTYNPFDPQIKDGVMYGRGTSDMKGGVAAFAVAALRFTQKHPDFKGSISLLITGDEEGPAKNGTVKVLEWMAENNHIPDVALVGEPTNPETLGDELKVGRRGSLTGRLVVKGKQGHVGYPHLADNPVPRLLKILSALCDHVFDTGNEYFSATNLEVTTIDIGNSATNIIPGQVKATFNIRFNDIWSAETLSEKVHEIIPFSKDEYDLNLRCGAESFLTQPGEWSETVSKAVHDITGRTPELSTAGGTSDARFMTNYCEVVEFGTINQTVHQINENTKVSDVEILTDIYERMLERYFAV